MSTAEVDQMVPGTSAEAGSDERHGVEWPEVARIGLVALAAAGSWFHLWPPIRGLDLIGLAATLVGGWPIFREALENIVERRMTMELSMTIALVAALAIGETFTALVITLFVLVAEVLEGLTVARGRHAIEDLLRFLPRAALVRRDGEIVEIPAEDLRVGDRVLVNPGSALPVDGIVLEGLSFVDQATITGESMPVEKQAGAVKAETPMSGRSNCAFMGTSVRSGTATVLVVKTGRATAPT